LLQARAKEIQASLDAFAAGTSASEKAAQVGPERMRALWQLTGDFGTAYYQFELAWLEKTIKKISKLPPLK
jgi:hypothetical protein